MANNCNNYITISGNQKDIAAISKLISNAGGNPYRELMRTIKNDELGNDAKWFDMGVLDIDDDNEITISGDSAWSPSLELFTKISEMFPNVKIRYEYSEGGCDFAGWADIENGECTDNCFRYYEGLSKINYSDFADQIFMNVEDFEGTEEDLRAEGFFSYLEDDDKAELISNYHELKKQN